MGFDVLKSYQIEIGADTEKFLKELNALENVTKEKLKGVDLSKGFREDLIKLQSDVKDMKETLTNAVSEINKEVKRVETGKLEKEFKDTAKGVETQIGNVTKSTKQLGESIETVVSNADFTALTNSFKEMQSSIEKSIDSLSKAFTGFFNLYSNFEQDVRNGSIKFKSLDNAQKAAEESKKALKDVAKANEESSKKQAEAAQKAAEAERKAAEEREAAVKRQIEAAELAAKRIENAYDKIKNALNGGVTSKNTTDVIEYLRILEDLDKEYTELKKLSPEEAFNFANDLIEDTNTLKEYAKQLKNTLDSFSNVGKANKEIRLKIDLEDQTKLVEKIDGIIQKVQTQINKKPIKIPLGVQPLIEVDNEALDEAAKTKIKRMNDKDGTIKAISLTANFDKNKFVESVNSQVDAITAELKKSEKAVHVDLVVDPVNESVQKAVNKLQAEGIDTKVNATTVQKISASTILAADGKLATENTLVEIKDILRGFGQSGRLSLTNKNEAVSDLNKELLTDGKSDISRFIKVRYGEKNISDAERKNLEYIKGAISDLYVNVAKRDDFKALHKALDSSDKKKALEILENSKYYLQKSPLQRYNEKEKKWENVSGQYEAMYLKYDEKYKTYTEVPMLYEDFQKQVRQDFEDMWEEISTTKKNFNSDMEVWLSQKATKDGTTKWQKDLIEKRTKFFSKIRDELFGKDKSLISDKDFDLIKADDSSLGSVELQRKEYIKSRIEEARSLMPDKEDVDILKAFQEKQVGYLNKLIRETEGTNGKILSEVIDEIKSENYVLSKDEKTELKALWRKELRSYIDEVRGVFSSAMNNLEKSTKSKKDTLRDFGVEYKTEKESDKGKKVGTVVFREATALQESDVKTTVYNAFKSFQEEREGIERDANKKIEDLNKKLTILQDMLALRKKAISSADMSDEEKNRLKDLEKYYIKEYKVDKKIIDTKEKLYEHLKNTISQIDHSILLEHGRKASARKTEYKNKVDLKNKIFENKGVLYKNFDPKAAQKELEELKRNQSLINSFLSTYKNDVYIPETDKTQGRLKKAGETDYSSLTFVESKILEENEKRINFLKEQLTLYNLEHGITEDLYNISKENAETTKETYKIQNHLVSSDISSVLFDSDTKDKKFTEYTDEQLENRRDALVKLQDSLTEVHKEKNNDNAIIGEAEASIALLVQILKDRLDEGKSDIEKLNKEIIDIKNSENNDEVKSEYIAKKEKKIKKQEYLNSRLEDRIKMISGKNDIDVLTGNLSSIQEELDKSVFSEIDVLAKKKKENNTKLKNYLESTYDDDKILELLTNKDKKELVLKALVEESYRYDTKHPERNKRSLSEINAGIKETTREYYDLENQVNERIKELNWGDEVLLELVEAIKKDNDELKSKYALLNDVKKGKVDVKEEDRYKYDYDYYYSQKDKKESIFKKIEDLKSGKEKFVREKLLESMIGNIKAKNDVSGYIGANGILQKEIDAIESVINKRQENVDSAKDAEKELERIENEARQRVQQKKEAQDKEAADFKTTVNSSITDKYKQVDDDYKEKKTATDNALKSLNEEQSELMKQLNMIEDHSAKIKDIRDELDIVTYLSKPSNEQANDLLKPYLDSDEGYLNALQKAEEVKLRIKAIDEETLKKTKEIKEQEEKIRNLTESIRLSKEALKQNYKEEINKELQKNEKSLETELQKLEVMKKSFSVRSKELKAERETIIPVSQYQDELDELRNELNKANEDLLKTKDLMSQIFHVDFSGSKQSLLSDYDFSKEIGKYNTIAKQTNGMREIIELWGKKQKDIITKEEEERLNKLIVSYARFNNLLKENKDGKKLVPNTKEIAQIVSSNIEWYDSIDRKDLKDAKVRFDNQRQSIADKTNRQKELLDLQSKESGEYKARGALYKAQEELVKKYNEVKESISASYLDDLPGFIAKYKATLEEIDGILENDGVVSEELLSNHEANRKNLIKQYRDIKLLGTDAFKDEKIKGTENEYLLKHAVLGEESNYKKIAVLSKNIVKEEEQINKYNEEEVKILKERKGRTDEILRLRSLIADIPVDKVDVSEDSSRSDKSYNKGLRKSRDQRLKEQTAAISKEVKSEYDAAVEDLRNFINKNYINYLKSDEGSKLLVKKYNRFASLGGTNSDFEKLVGTKKTLIKDIKGFEGIKSLDIDMPKDRQRAVILQRINDLERENEKLIEEENVSLNKLRTAREEQVANVERMKEQQKNAFVTNVSRENIDLEKRYEDEKKELERQLREEEAAQEKANREKEAIRDKIKANQEKRKNIEAAQIADENERKRSLSSFNKEKEYVLELQNLINTNQYNLGEYYDIQAAKTDYWLKKVEEFNYVLEEQKDLLDERQYSFDNLTKGMIGYDLETFKEDNTVVTAEYFKELSEKDDKLLTTIEKRRKAYNKAIYDKLKEEKPEASEEELLKAFEKKKIQFNQEYLDAQKLLKDAKRDYDALSKKGKEYWTEMSKYKKLVNEEYPYYEPAGYGDIKLDYDYAQNLSDIEYRDVSKAEQQKKASQESARKEVEKQVAEETKLAKIRKESNSELQKNSKWLKGMTEEEKEATLEVSKYNKQLREQNWYRELEKRLGDKLYDSTRKKMVSEAKYQELVEKTQQAQSKAKALGLEIDEDKTSKRYGYVKSLTDVEIANREGKLPISGSVDVNKVVTPGALATENTLVAIHDLLAEKLGKAKIGNYTNKNNASGNKKKFNPYDPTTYEHYDKMNKKQKAILKEWAEAKSKLYVDGKLDKEVDSKLVEIAKRAKEAKLYVSEKKISKGQSPKGIYYDTSNLPKGSGRSERRSEYVTSRQSNFDRINSKTYFNYDKMNEAQKGYADRYADLHKKLFVDGKLDKAIETQMLTLAQEAAEKAGLTLSKNTKGTNVPKSLYYVPPKEDKENKGNNQQTVRGSNKFDVKTPETYTGYSFMNNIEKDYINRYSELAKKLFVDGKIDKAVETQMTSLAEEALNNAETRLKRNKKNIGNTKAPKSLYLPPEFFEEQNIAISAEEKVARDIIKGISDEKRFIKQSKKPEKIEKHQNTLNEWLEKAKNNPYLELVDGVYKLKKAAEETAPAVGELNGKVQEGTTATLPSSDPTTTPVGNADNNGQLGQLKSFVENLKKENQALGNEINREQAILDRRNEIAEKYQMFGLEDISDKDLIPQLKDIKARFEAMSAELNSEGLELFSIEEVLDGRETILAEWRKLEQVVETPLTPVISTAPIVEQIQEAERNVEGNQNNLVNLGNVIKYLSSYDNKSLKRSEQGLFANLSTGEMSSIGTSEYSNTITAELSRELFEEVAGQVDTFIHSHPQSIAALSPSDVSALFNRTKDGITKALVVSFDEVATFDASKIKAEDFNNIKTQFLQKLTEETNELAKIKMSQLASVSGKLNESSGKIINDILYDNVNIALKKSFASNNTPDFTNILPLIKTKIDEVVSKIGLSDDIDPGKLTTMLMPELTNALNLDSGIVGKFESRLYQQIRGIFSDVNAEIDSGYKEVMQSLVRESLMTVLSNNGYNPSDIYKVSSVDSFTNALVPQSSVGAVTEQTQAETKVKTEETTKAFNLQKATLKELVDEYYRLSDALDRISYEDSMGEKFDYFNDLLYQRRDIADILELNHDFDAFRIDSIIAPDGSDTREGVYNYINSLDGSKTVLEKTEEDAEKQAKKKAEKQEISLVVNNDDAKVEIQEIIEQKEKLEDVVKEIIEQKEKLEDVVKEPINITANAEPVVEEIKEAKNIVTKLKEKATDIFASVVRNVSGIFRKNYSASKELITSQDVSTESFVEQQSSIIPEIVSDLKQEEVITENIAENIEQQVNAEESLLALRNKNAKILKDERRLKKNQEYTKEQHLAAKKEMLEAGFLMRERKGKNAKENSYYIPIMPNSADVKESDYKSTEALKKKLFGETTEVIEEQTVVIKENNNAADATQIVQSKEQIEHASEDVTEAAKEEKKSLEEASTADDATEVVQEEGEKKDSLKGTTEEAKKQKDALTETNKSDDASHTVQEEGKKAEFTRDATEEFKEQAQAQDKANEAADSSNAVKAEKEIKEATEGATDAIEDHTVKLEQAKEALKDYIKTTYVDDIKKDPKGLLEKYDAYIAAGGKAEEFKDLVGRKTSLIDLVKTLREVKTEAEGAKDAVGGVVSGTGTKSSSNKKTKDTINEEQNLRIRSKFEEAAKNNNLSYNKNSLKVSSEGVITFTKVVKEAGKVAHETKYKIDNLYDALDQNTGVLDVSKFAVTTSPTTKVDQSLNKQVASLEKILKYKAQISIADDNIEKAKLESKLKAEELIYRNLVEKSKELLSNEERRALISSNPKIQNAQELLRLAVPAKKASVVDEFKNNLENILKSDYANRISEILPALYDSNAEARINEAKEDLEYLKQTFILLSDKNFDIFKFDLKDLDKARKAMERFKESKSIFSKDMAVGDSKYLTTINDSQARNLQDTLKKLAIQFSGAKINIKGFTNSNREMTYQVLDSKNMINTYTIAIKENGEAIAHLVKSEKKLNLFQKTFQTMGRKFGEILNYTIASVSIYEVFNFFRRGISVVQEMDVAMTELRKVSNETEQALESFRKESFNIATTIGSTGKEIVNSAADWSKLGYSIKEASELAKNSALYANVGDMEIDEATEHMVSTLKAFNIEAKDSISIVDKFNEIGNNYAISSAGIGEALERSAASLVAAGNDIDKSIALITAGNIISQDPESVGNAIKVLSLRIRGSKSELEELGEETDNLASSSSKLREEIQALTGVDVMFDNNTYKDTYTILLEISKVWDKLSDVSQANVLEKLAGKTRASVVAGLLQQGETLEKVYKDSQNAEGSALKENEKYMESIQGHLDILTNKWQQMWDTAIEPDFINFFIDLGSSVLDFVNKFGAIKSAILGLGALFGLKGALNSNGGGRAKNFVVIRKLITPRSLINT